MNCLALLAHCHRTGTRIQLLENESSNAINRGRVRVQNVMEASLYERSPVRSVITPGAMQELVRTASFVCNGGSPNDTQCCPITQSEFAEGDTALVLPCGHAFMKDAIQTWLENESAECPVCRHALPSHEIIIMGND